MAATHSFTLRYAGHLGLLGPDQPLFFHHANSGDPVDQIACLADLGFAGVFDNFLALREVAVQEAIGRGSSSDRRGGRSSRDRVDL